jgi:N-acetylmuramoyl-L-alanine amidase
VRLTTLPAGVFVPADTTIIATDGLALGYLRRARGVSARLAARATLVARAGGVTPARRSLAGTGTPQRAGFVTAGIADSALVLPDSRRPAWLDRNGFAALAERAGEPFRMPRLAGYRTLGADTAWPARVSAIAGGALHGRRIMLDPEGGGDDAAGISKSGTRASALNLEVARALAAMLSAAGADVGLTRDAEQAVSELERVQRAEGFRAERYLRIGHANRPPMAGHYFSSGGGRRWGQRVAATLTQLGLPTLSVGESAKYPIAQVSAVALDVSLARTDSSDAELRSPGRLRAEAYALFVALAAELAGPGIDWPTDSLTVLDAAGLAIAGAPVRLGGALVLQTGADGIVRFIRSEPGPIEVVVEDPRAPLRALLLDSERGRVLRAPR